MKEALLTTAYLAPVQYYSKLISYEKILIEQFENYNRQSYRNRCNIYSANGLLALTIPIKKAEDHKILTKDAVIDYDTPWQKLHWKALEAAYRSSPFYEFFVDDFEMFYHKSFKYLIDFNLEIQSVVLKTLRIKANIESTTDYCFNRDNEYDDFRAVIHPKRELALDQSFVAKPYTQVFSTKFGFLPNLSIIDLLFNTGKESVHYLR